MTQNDNSKQNNSGQNPLRKKTDFWLETLDAVRFLALFFSVYLGIPLFYRLFGGNPDYQTYVNLITFLICGILTFLLIPKKNKRLIPFGENGKKSQSVLACLSIFLLAVGIAVLLNRIFAVIPWDLFLEEKNQYSTEKTFQIPFAVSLLGYGFIAPFAEEVAFRGILYPYLEKILPPVWAIFISAFFFGLYHGNLMQGIYAFLLGVMMAFLVYKTHSLGASMLFHMSANIIVTCYANIPSFYQFLMSIPGTVLVLLCLGLGILLFAYVAKRDKNRGEEGV